MSQTVAIGRPEGRSLLRAILEIAPALHAATRVAQAIEGHRKPARRDLNALGIPSGTGFDSGFRH